MERIFAYCYVMEFKPEKLKTLIPAHIAYWTEHAPEKFTGGPFGDRTGGLISFSAADLSEAELICSNDPYIKEGLVQEYWVKEWLVSHQR